MKTKAYKVLWAGVVLLGALNYVVETFREIKKDNPNDAEEKKQEGLFRIFDSILVANALMGVISLFIKVRQIFFGKS